MVLNKPIEVDGFARNNVFQSARLVFAFCLFQDRNEWVNWSGDTSIVSRFVDPVFHLCGEAERVAESKRSAGTCFYIKDTLAILLLCRNSQVVCVFSETSNAVSYRKLVNFVEAGKPSNNVGKMLDKFRQSGDVRIFVFQGKSQKPFIDFDPKEPLFLRASKAGGRLNGLAWSIKPYTPSYHEAKKAVAKINAHLNFNEIGTSKSECVSGSNLVVKLSSNQSAYDGYLHSKADSPADFAANQATVKEQLVLARRGQGVFKERVKVIEACCRLTGVMDIDHLRASHIKPWRDSSDEEKLDGNNGFLLSPHVDHLFDKGYISFLDDGRVLISNLLSNSVLRAWGLNLQVNVGNFNEEQKRYLKYHREYVFKAKQDG